MRVMQNPIYVDAFKAIGMNPTPLPYGEVYSALQLHVVDAAENPVGPYYYQKFYEVAPYFTRTYHQFSYMHLFMSLQTWNKLSPEDQKIIMEGAQAYREAMYLAAKAEEKTIEEKLKAEGVEFIDLSKEDKEKLVSLAKQGLQPYIEELRDYYKEKLGYDIFDALENPEKYGGSLKFEYFKYTPGEWTWLEYEE